VIWPVIWGGAVVVGFVTGLFVFGAFR